MPPLLVQIGLRTYLNELLMADKSTYSPKTIFDEVAD